MTASLWSTFDGKPICKPGNQDAAKSLRNRSRVARVHMQQQQPPNQPDNLPAKHNGNNGNAEGLGKTSPDILRLFSETQRNLLELNRSRLSALDELRLAKNKISDLESQLEAKAESVRDKESASQQSAAENLHEEPPSSSSTQQMVGQNIITIAYQTGWPRVMMHYSADGQTWTDLPGVEMQPGKEEFAGSKVLQVKGNQLEFVLNDGAGQWDTPDPYGSSQTKNYIISTPGRYCLEAGEVRQIQ